VAKLAAERAKPHAEEGSGVFIVSPGEEAAFLETLDLAAIPGIGPRLQERLRIQGLTRVVEARRVPVATLRNWLGGRMGDWLHERLQGIGGTTVHPREDPRSVSREETFPVDHDDDTVLQGELLRLTERLGRDLRRAGLRASIVTLKLRDFDFQTRSASRTVPAPMSTRQALYPVACDLLRSLRLRRRVPVRLLGIAATRLTTGESPAQLGLFPADQDGSHGTVPGESPRDRHLATVLDRIALRFGDRAILPGRLASIPAPRTPRESVDSTARRGPSPPM
jgi:DNA polymerase-4